MKRGKKPMSWLRKFAVQFQAGVQSGFAERWPDLFGQRPASDGQKEVPKPKSWPGAKSGGGYVEPKRKGPRKKSRWD